MQTLNFAGSLIELDLTKKHEKAYAEKIQSPATKHPQADLDEKIFERFIRKGDVVLDCGANIGFTALEALNAGAKKVIAIEAVPELFSRLKKLSSGEISVIGKAVSDQIGEIEMTVSNSHNQGSTVKKEVVELFPAVFQGETKTIKVQTTTIDEICSNEKADVWKLDIEGAEVDALKGGIKTLMNHPPRTIIAELFNEKMVSDFEDILEDFIFGWRAFLRKDNYELELVPVGNEINEELYHSTSPMYVFSRFGLQTEKEEKLKIRQSLSMRGNG